MWIFVGSCYILQFLQDLAFFLWKPDKILGLVSHTTYYFVKHNTNFKIIIQLGFQSLVGWWYLAVSCLSCFILVKQTLMSFIGRWWSGSAWSGESSLAPAGFRTPLIPVCRPVTILTALSYLQIICILNLWLWWWWWIILGKKFRFLSDHSKLCICINISD
jgi:hypothetical protein